MGIKIINGFDLNSPLPLDSRAVVENATEMSELVTKNFVSIGQTCFNKADNKLYVLKDNGEILEWSEVGKSNYKPLIFTNMTSSEGDYLIELTDEEYNSLVSAIENKENVIAYAQTENINLPLFAPTKYIMKNNNASITFYSGSASWLNAVLLSSSYVWALYSKETGIVEGKNVIYIQSLPNFEQTWGLYVDTNNNSIMFGNGGNLQIQGSIAGIRKIDDISLLQKLDNQDGSADSVYLDHINGNSIIHTSADDVKNYTIPTITFED